MQTVEEKKDKLKHNLSIASRNLDSLAMNLPENCASIISTDSFGKNPQTLGDLLKSISSKFGQLEEELDTPFKIAVVGSQGTGKSTVINLLLDENIMPSTLEENEGAIIRFAYPPTDDLKNKAVIELSDNTTKTMTIEEATLIIDKNKRKPEDDTFVKSIVYVTFYKNNPQLKKIELINTPGMNVITDDFYPKVRHLFVKADIIIWNNSKEQILDSFNSELIKNIYADNHKIVGLLTFPDKLYRMDSNTGVTDVVRQFMDEIENNMLMRINGEVALFVFHGRFAQIAEKHNEKAKFVTDIDDISDDESKLRMLYNYLHHGFAYSDIVDNVKILEDYKLLGMNSTDKTVYYKADFDLNAFYSYCINEKYCAIDNETQTAPYTDKGRFLLGEASQFSPFKHFSEDHLNTTSLGEKYDLVRNRLANLFKIKDQDNSSKARLLQINKQFEGKQRELDDTEQQRSNDFTAMLSQLETGYNEWVDNQLDFKSVKYVDDFLEHIFDKFENEINHVDFAKEILSTVTSVFNKSKESPVSKKISNIISESIEVIFPVHIEKLGNDAQNQIELILINMNKNFLSEKNDLNNNPNIKNIRFDTDIDLSRIVELLNSMIGKMGKPKIKDLIIKIIKKDLRKGSNNFLKTKIIKPIVKTMRSLIKTIGVKIVKKKAAKTVAKGSMGPMGGVLVAWDVVTLGKDLHDMYKEMKKSLKEQIEDEPSFRDFFKNEANNVCKNIHTTIKQQLTDEFVKEAIDVSYVLNGLSVCNDAISELNKIENEI